MVTRAVVCDVVICATLLATGLSADAAPPVRFNRDVRPILADNCFKCHGPDAIARQAELRLDTRDGLFAAREGGAPVKPRDAAASPLAQRLRHTDPSQRMPPAESGKVLSPAQIDLLARWIAEGAVWEDHWAFVPPHRTPPPDVQQSGWSRTAVDRFVLQKLTERGWTPQPEAAPETLVRRATLDLTGLPPTPAEVDAYLADAAPDRYERLVDRLLASPRAGEHLAVDWLDAARYADTSGYQNDGPRQMWRWRDWVIDAFNANVPFDRFTVEQLAGDLLLAERERAQQTSPSQSTTGSVLHQPRGYLPRDPQAVELLVATGFQRNHRGNSEGGIIAEEYAVEYVADRVDTAGAVWLGLTVGCARCHTHKYDPLTQTDYYRLFAYFNRVPEYGRSIKEGNSPPYITAPTAAQWPRWRQLEAELTAARAAWSALQAEAAVAQRAWEQTLLGQSPVDLTVMTGLLDHFPFATDWKNAAHSTKTKFHSGEARFISSPAGAALALDGQQFVNAGDRAKFGYFEAFSATAWIRPSAPLTGGIVSRTSDDAYEDGWAFQLHDGALQVNLVKRWLDDAIRVETTARLEPDRWTHVGMTYDGSRTAAGIVITIDGVPQPLTVHYDFLNQTFTNEEPLRIGSTGTHRRLTGAIADVRVYRGALAPADLAILATPETLTALAAIPTAQRTPLQNEKLHAGFLKHGASPQLAAAAQRIRQATHDYRYFTQFVLSTAMVMVDDATLRATNVLQRGAYDRPGEPVTADVPAALSAATGPVGGNRLDFARWLVNSRHPLTARVTVNRLWQRLFGVGLVKTSEDFGTQGEPPSHPELLDWLAVELVESGWNLRHVQRLLVTSAAYRQSSHITPELAQADPENRFLARGPRFRLSAEMLRDQALAASGLLEERLGGPSINPYQPDGLWKEIATDTQYAASPAPDVYRRSLYCYSKRTVANPTLALFDASTREACTVRRGRTNTPLQALTLWNDATFVEAARVLAETAVRASAATPKTTLPTLFRRVTSRAPEAEELAQLVISWTHYLEEFQRDTTAAKAWLQVGTAPAWETNDPATAAAYVAIASVLLNLDEVVTKE
jgi:hypothetical protein